MKSETGFTLVELIAAMAVMLIALMMVAPNYRLLVENNRLTSQTNNFVLAMNLARAEAIKRKFPTIFCPSSDQANCSATGEWEDGWLIVLDNDSTGTQTAGDTLLKVFPALSEGTTLRATPGTPHETSIVYQPTGFTSAAIGQGQLIVCDDRGLDLAYAIVISTSGRPQLFRDEDVEFPFSTCNGDL